MFESKSDAVDQLNQYIEEIDRLKDMTYGAPVHARWSYEVRDYVRSVFGQDSMEYTELRKLISPPEASYLRVRDSMFTDPVGALERERYRAYLEYLAVLGEFLRSICLKIDRAKSLTELKKGSSQAALDEAFAHLQSDFEGYKRRASLGSVLVMVLLLGILVTNQHLFPWFQQHERKTALTLAVFLLICAVGVYLWPTSRNLYGIVLSFIGGLLLALINIV